MSIPARAVRRQSMIRAILRGHGTDEEDTMRFMIIVKATPESEAGTLPGAELLAQMAGYHEELARAGALLDAAGLAPSSAGWRIRYDGTTRAVTEGPFADAANTIAGYTLIQARTREEALEWAKRFPNPRGTGRPAEIEIRPLLGLGDFSPSEAVERFRELGVGQ
jgi:hypothetical protein